MLGLPQNWEEVEEWIDGSRDVAPTDKKPRAPWQKKNPEIPILKNYQDAVAHGPAPCEDPPCGLHMWCVYTHIYM